MRLVYKATQQPVKLGDTVVLRDGQGFTVDFFSEPHKPDSEGKVTLLAEGAERPHGTEVYVSGIGAEWIEREDRRESPTGEDVWPDEDPPADFDPEFPAAPHDDEADAHQRERVREDGPQ